MARRQVNDQAVMSVLSSPESMKTARRTRDATIISNGVKRTTPCSRLKNVPVVHHLVKQSIILIVDSKWRRKARKTS